MWNGGDEWRALSEGERKMREGGGEQSKTKDLHNRGMHGAVDCLTCFLVGLTCISSRGTMSIRKSNMSYLVIARAMSDLFDGKTAGDKEEGTS